jgi:hypothetical protein
MNYSYLNTVFPNFEYKVNPNIRLFNSLDNKKESENKNNDNEKNVIVSAVNDIVKRAEIPINTFSKRQIEDNPVEKNNLRVYQPQLNILENLSDVNKDDNGCMKSFNHVYTCKLCNEKFTNLMNMENGRNNDNNELWEIIIYIIFSLFVLFLIDKLHK